MKIAIVVPHIFMNEELLPNLIFAPGFLAISLADGLVDLGHDVSLFSPAKVSTKAKNITADLSEIEKELKLRGYGYTQLLKNHPLSFITLVRQVQTEIVAQAYQMANEDKFDIVHIYTNEEEVALPFSKLCKKPVVFTHHEPFNFLAKYRGIFPKYKDLKWISISMSQQKGMPMDTNWVGNVYHGIEKEMFTPVYKKDEYLAYFGRIIKPKGVEYAIKTAKKLGMKLKIAGKHYGDVSNDKYWEEISPLIDGKNIEYVGFISKDSQKNEFLGKARALLVPSVWDEPFGMVSIEAMACATPVVGFNKGALSEVINEGICGYIAEYIEEDKEKSIENMCSVLKKALKIDNKEVRKQFEKRFTSQRMCQDYEDIYSKVLKNN